MNMVFNKSDDYSILGFIILVSIIHLIYLCIFGGLKCTPSRIARVICCIATIICCFILIYILPKNISHVEQNNNDNKNMLIKKKADAYHSGPNEINSIEDVPEEFYRHVYYLYRQPTDGKCVFCSDYTISPDRILIDVEDDTFFYFVCTKEIADKILEIHKSNGGPGSGWEYWE